MSESNSRRGISFFGALTILFIGLKLSGSIDWSWIWVLGPLWMPFGLVVAFWLCAGIVAAGLLVVAAICDGFVGVKTAWSPRRRIQ